MLSTLATLLLVQGPSTVDAPNASDALAPREPRAQAHYAPSGAPPWTPGTAHELVLTIEGGDPRWWGDPAQVMRSSPILQLDVPPSVRLLGAPPTEPVTPRDFELGYLRFPEGRKLVAARTRVAFELTREPSPEERLGLNLVYWIEEDGELRFLRQRLELPLAPGAEGEPADPANTRWGSHAPLNVGDTPELRLTSHRGDELALEDFRGAPLLLVTYRAHW